MNRIMFVMALMWGVTLSAQRVANDYLSLNDELVKRGYEEEVNLDELAGSPFWEDKFLPGEVRRKGDKEFEGYFRFNVLKDEIQIKVDAEEENFYVLPRWNDVEYALNGYSYFLDHFKTEDKNSLYGYFIKYYQGEHVKFYGKPEAKVFPAQRAETSYDKPTPATVKMKSHYYVQVGDAPLVEVRLRERHFRKLFNDSARMKTYFKEHKVNEVEDVVEMLKFYEVGE